MKYYPLVNYFKYNNQFFTNGTKVELSDYFVNNYQYNNRKIWRKVLYHNSLYRNNKLEHFFTSYDYNVRLYTNYVMIPDELLESAIKNIIQPKYIFVQEKDTNKEKLFIVSIIYVLFMFMSLCFNEFYIFWILNTIVFLVVGRNIYDC